jgi:hypothetical protein
MRPLSLLIFLVLAGSATAAIVESSGAPAAQPTALAAAGSFSFADSRDGMPIFNASGIGPGDSATGTVEIFDDGEEPIGLTLGQHDLEDAPGVGGGVLSPQLTLLVSDVTTPGAPSVVYSGPLATMPDQPAGRLEPGQTRSFEFRATLPDTASPAGAGGQNELQGASTSVAYSWTAAEAPALPPSEPEPEGSPSPPVPAPPLEYIEPTSLLRVRIAKAPRRLRGSSLLVRVRCNSSCRVTLRGRLRLRDGDAIRTAKLRFKGRRYRSGNQRLRVGVPRRLSAWARSQPGRSRGTARLVLTARGPGGEKAKAHRTLRLRR